MKKKIMLQANVCPTIEEAIQMYIKKCTVKNMSPRTIHLYEVDINDFLKYCGEEIEYVSDITSSTVDNYILNRRKSTSCGDITINSHLRSIRAFLYWAMEERYITNPFGVSIPKVEKKIKETYTEAELRILLKKPNIKQVSFNEYKTWVYINYLLATGNRLSSALNVRIRNIDFDSAIIHIEKTKNRRQQLIPLSVTLASILQEYLQYRNGEPEDYLFCNSYGGQADERTTQDQLKDYNRARGVAKTSSHLFRHTFAKQWILAGGDIFRLQKILGHSDLTVVKEYVNMFSNDVAVDFDKFNPLDNMNMKNRDTIKMARRKK